MSPKVSLFALLLGLVGCSADCVNEVREELVSPDGKRKIVVFSRNCGATTGFSTQASVLERAETLPNEGGSLFVVDHVIEEMNQSFTADSVDALVDEISANLKVAVDLVADSERRRFKKKEPNQAPEPTAPSGHGSS